MARSPAVTVSEAYLAGGGEMGQRMRRIDWSQTPSVRWNVAAEPQECGQHPAAVKGADRPLLGFRAHHDLQRRLCACVRRQASVGPRSSRARVLERGVARHRTAVRGSWSGRVRRSGRRTTPSFSSGRSSSKRRTSTSRTIRSASRTAVSAASSAFVSEQTGRVLGERRLRTLRELGTRTAGAKSAEEVCREAAATLALDPADVPFSLLYLIDGWGTPRGARRCRRHRA